MNKDKETGKFKKTENIKKTEAKILELDHRLKNIREKSKSMECYIKPE